MQWKESIVPLEEDANHSFRGTPLSVPSRSSIAAMDVMVADQSFDIFGEPNRSKYFLKSIKVSNFKSYRGDFEIDPFPVDENSTYPLVCVVGPNGSGKSNLMDAIAFCFNCADPTKLRGDGSVANLISNCSDENLQNASVTVTLAAKDAAVTPAEMEFSRIINTRNESKYRLNGKSITLEKYRDAMKSCGLDVKGNFLVFQGDVESLALSDPVELGAIFDRISGSGDSKKEYDSLTRRKSDLEGDYARLASRKRKLVNDKKRIKNELGEIEKINSLESEKANLSTITLLSKLFVLDQELKQIRIDTAGHVDSDLSEMLKSKEGSLNELKSSRAKADMRVSKLSRKLLTLNDADLRAALTTLEDRRTKVSLHEKRLESIAADISKTKQTSAALKEKIIHVDKRLVETNASLEREMQNMDELTSRGLANLAQQRVKEHVVPFLRKHASMSEDEIIRRVHKFQCLEIPLKTCELAEKMSASQKKIADLRSAVSVIEDRRSELSDQLVRNERNEQEVAERISSISSELTEKQKALKKLTKEVNSLKTVKIAERIQRVETDRSKLIDELNDIKDNEAEIAKEKDLADTVMELSNRFGTGFVLGRVVDLIQPVDAKYSTAIQTAVGKFMDAVLVKSVETAKDCVAYLKECRKGSITFVPVDDVTVSTPPKSGSFEISAIDAVNILAKNNDSITRGIKFVLGNTVICETLKSARHVAYSTKGIKVVTLSGDKISSNGNITLSGGAGASRFGLKKVGDISKRLDALDSELSDTRAELAKEEKKGFDMGKETREMELWINQMTADLGRLKQEHQRLHESVLVIGKFLEENRQESDAKDREIEILTSNQREISAQICDTAMTLAKDFVRNLDPSAEASSEVLSAIAGSEESDASLEGAKKNQRKIISQLEVSLGSLKSELRCLEAELAEQPSLSDAAKAEVALRKTLAAAERELAKTEVEVEKLRSMAEDISKQLSEAQLEKSSADTKIKTLISELQGLKSQHSRVSEEAAKKRKATERIQNNKIQILKDSVVANTYIPLKLDPSDLATGSQEAVSRQIVESVFISLSALVPFGTQPFEPSPGEAMDGLMEEVLRKIDFESLSSDIKKKAKTVVEKGRANMYMTELDSQLRDRVREINAELDIIGGISKSSSSSADLEKIETELMNISSEAEGAKSELTGITKQIKEIRKERNVKFLNCFKFTSAKVDELYKALTSYSDSNTSLGSDAIVPLDVASTAAASLDLETPAVGSDLTACEVFNSGVIFSLMPPYKRYTNIELLSGGEKTVAAVALLFALLAYAGPPFSMVDEIDAALDADNVAVLSRFMKRAVDHQLIVISLKEKMYAKADCLIGVYKNISTQGSGIVTLDLRQYPETTDGEQQDPVVYEKRASDTTPAAPVTEKRQGRVLAGGA